jgi:catechol 2,3-dioxygenase-like lactoylglutathione lyase family enzyme
LKGWSRQGRKRRRKWRSWHAARPKLTHLELRLEDMDATAVDLQVISPSPTQYYYWADADLAAVLVREQNEAIAALCQKHPDRLAGLGNVALQHADLAVRQLEHAVRTLGLKGVEISTAINAPGALPQRPANIVAVDEDAVIDPRTLSHVVYFVPDAAKAEAFYTRLGFRCTDRFIGAGPLLRPAGSLDHHCLFLIRTPAFMKGCEHFTFHLAGPTELMQAGNRFVNKGYKSFWGPGRHRLGSNWFWYFNSPLGCHVEYDADMDLHDQSWVARDVPINADSSQLFLFQQRQKWSPGGPPAPGGAH